MSSSMRIMKVSKGLHREKGCGWVCFMYCSFLILESVVAPSALLGRLDLQSHLQLPASFVAAPLLHSNFAGLRSECSSRPSFRLPCARASTGQDESNPSTDKNNESPDVLLLRPPTRPGVPSTAQDLPNSLGPHKAPVQLQKKPGHKTTVSTAIKQGKINLYKIRNVKELVEMLEARGNWAAEAMSAEDISFAVNALFRMADVFNTKSKPSPALVDRARVQVDAILAALASSASLLPGAMMAKAVNAASRLSKKLYPDARTQPQALISFFAAVSVRTKAICHDCVGGGEKGLAQACELDSRTLAILLNALSKAGQVSQELCECTSAVIVRMATISGQDTALMLNAFSKTVHPPPRAAYQHLAKGVKRLLPSSLDTQAASMIVNAMAKADMRDTDLLRHLSSVVQSLPQNDFSPQAVSTIANAYAKLDHRDAALFAFLEDTTMLLPASAFSSQAVSMIVNSFVKAELQPKVLFRYLAGVACQINPKQFSAQSVALILHGFERCGLRDERLFSGLAAASKEMRFYDVQAVASVIGSFSYVGYEDQELYEHLVSSFMTLTSGRQPKLAAYDGQKAGMILGAAVKHNFLSTELLEHVGRLLMAMDRRQIQPFDIASIAHALSRAECQNQALMDHLARLVKEDTSLTGYSPPMLAMLVAAYTRSPEWDVDLLQCLASQVSIQPNEAWELPDLINLMSTNLRIKDRLGGCMISDEDYVSGKVSSGLAPEAASEHCLSLNGMSAEQISALSEMTSMLQRCCKARILSLSVDDFSLSLANNVYSHSARTGMMDTDKVFAKHVHGILATKLSTWIDEALKPALAELKQTASTSPSKVVSRTVQEGAQTVAVVAASLATAGGDEEELWTMTTKLALSLPTESFNARAVSTLLNAFARRGRYDQKILDRCSYILQHHVAGDLDPSVEAMQGNYELWTIGGATIGSVFNAYAKLQVKDEPLFQKMSRLARLLRPEDFHPVEISMIVNAIARLDYADEALFLHLREAVLSRNDTDEFGVQAIANIANAYARVKMLDSDLVGHLSALVRGYSPREWSAQHVATLANAWAKAEVKDEALWAHWSASILHMNRSDLDLQAIANIFHAMATLHVVDIGLIRRLSNNIVQMPISESNPQAAAIIAWSVAVLQPFVSLEANLRSTGQKETCREVVRWILDALVLHWTRLDRHCLSQVHQLLIGSRLSNLTMPVELDESHYRASLEAFTNSSEMISLSSNQQADVARTLTAIGYALKMEYIEPATGYSFDIWIPDENLVVEFDGPFHYCNSTRIPLGSTVMKHRHIRQMGYTLVVIPFWSWDISGSDALERKQQYLKEQIQIAFTKRDHGSTSSHDPTTV